ncbi:hypothetical protein CCHL11_08308 [Colletotrichum chlorophyti]|uniref:EthD domain-containing protein n=1 Tax=Colletotrichum chlorophyti TaxID=708187 RepID=A0A1Q8RMT3_9PEZI|nr:hypothetical protein CCHL11_08308 [Colletotrichum chlorophyti]
MDHRLLVYLYRKKGISHAEFRDHYEYIHIPLTRELTGSLFPSLHARRYIERSQPEDKPVVLIGDKSLDEYDAVVDVAFKNEEAAQAFFAATNSGKVAERLRKDNEQFLDWQRVRIVKVGDVFETRT